MTPAVHCDYCGWVDPPVTDHLSTCPENAPSAGFIETPPKLELERLAEGLRRLRDQDYDSGYTPETYANAVLTGHEPEAAA